MLILRREGNGSAITYLYNAIAHATILKGDNMVFSELVKYVRQELNISQEQLAHRLNISYSTVNRWETGKTKPLPVIKDRFIDFCEQEGIETKKILIKEEGH